MSLRSRSAALFVTLLVAVPVAVPVGPVVAAPEVAAQVWGPVTTLARNPRGEALVVDAAGTVTIVWAQSSTGRRVMALRRPAGGDWGTPVALGRGYSPQVATDEAGNVTAVWLTQRRGRSDGVMAAQRPAAGHWSDPVRLTRDVSVPGYVPDGEEVYGAARVDLAVSPGGDVVVLWDWGSDPRDVPWRIRSAYQPAGEAWGKQVDVTPASGANSPQVGVSADGAAVLVYGRQAMGHPQVLLARDRTPDGAWTRAVTIAAHGYTPALAVDRAGDALVVFTPNFNRVQAVVRPADLRWRTPRNLSPKGVAIQDYAAALNGRGSAVVALARGRGRVDLIRSRPLGRWTAPHRVASSAGTVFDVLVGLNDAGDTFVGWGGYDLLGRYRPAGGAWGKPSTISPDAGVEVLEATFAEVLPAGGVVVLWEQEARPLKVRLMSTS